jgi:ribonuclease HI
MSFYAVVNGRTIGIFTNWEDCNNSVKGFPNALFKKFESIEEARQFIETNIISSVEIINTNSVKFVPDYYVYTDGACLNNGKINAIAGIGIFFGVDDPRNISTKIDGNQTNNAAELYAILKTYSIIKEDIQNGKKITIVSDSQYAIRCVTSYGENCNKMGWIADIPNKELVKSVYLTYKDKCNINFIYIQAHTNNTDIHSIGNFNADKLANNAIGLDNCINNKLLRLRL